MNISEAEITKRKSNNKIGAVKKAPNKKDCDLAKKARQQSFFVV